MKHLIRKNKEEDDKNLFIKKDELPKGIEEITHRNYLNFMILAGVRRQGDTKSIQEKRGLPFDVSKKMKILSDQWGSDGHSHGWITIQEIIEFYRNDNELDQFHFEFMNTIKSYIDSVKKPKKTRLVFFFDN